MMATGIDLALLGVSLLGFFALALATERQAEQLLGHWFGGLPAPRWRWLARVVGWALLALSLAWSIDRLGVGIGIALWLGGLTVAALALVFAFPKWPWQAPEREKPVRKPKDTGRAAAPPPAARAGRHLAAVLLLATVAVFALNLSRVQPQLLKRADAVRGSAGPWSFVLAEADRDAPEIVDMDIPMKTFKLRFCEACDGQIRQVFLKVHKPRSARANGMAFMGARWERRVEIPLPSTLKADSELWLTVVGKDGSVHQAAWRIDQVSPATVAWFDRQRSAQHANP